MNHSGHLATIRHHLRQAARFYEAHRASGYHRDLECAEYHARRARLLAA